MGFSKLLLFAVFTFLLLLLVVSHASSVKPKPKPTQRQYRRLLVEDEESVLPSKPNIIKTSSTSLATDKPIKSSANSPTTSSKNNNKTKLIKPISASLKTKPNSISSDSPPLFTSDSATVVPKTKHKKLNSTSINKSPDLLKTPKPVNTESAITNKMKKKEPGNEIDPKSASVTKIDNQFHNPKKQQQTIYNSEEDDDLVSDLADLPAKFQQTIIPDLKKITSSSQIYLSKANKQFTKGFKPYVGNKHAATFAGAISIAFIIIPFILVSLLINHIKAYFSLQRLLIFIQVYLSIYFSILCLSSIVTGLEPLRFFYATSQSTYVWLQVIQTMGYVLYLLMLLMYLVLVFSTDTGLRMKFLGLAQTLLGLSVGLHYYMTVFHWMVLRQPPKATWKVHAVYATCFLVICLLAGADGRKKAYLGEGGEDAKKS